MSSTQLKYLYAGRALYFSALGQANQTQPLILGLAMKKSISIVSPPTLGDQSYPSLHQNHRVIMRYFPCCFCSAHFEFSRFFRFLNKNGQQHQRCYLEHFNFSMNGALHGGHYTIENGCVFLVKQMLRVSKL